MDNVSRLAWLKFFYAMNFTSAVFVPFLSQVCWDDPGLVFYLEALFMATWGSMAYVVSAAARRCSNSAIILAGCVLWIIGFAIYAAAVNLAMCLVAEVVIATAVACHSGTIDALLTDTLQAQRRWTARRSRMFRQHIAYHAGAAVSTLIGGEIADAAGLRLTILATLVPAACGLWFAWGLVDPPKRQDLPAPAPLGTVVAGLLTCPARVGLVLMGASLFALVVFLTWSMQIYQQELGFSFATMGKWNFATLVACATFSLLVGRLERLSDDRKPISDRSLLAGIVIAVLVSLFCASRIRADWGVIFFLLGRATISMSIPVTLELVGRFATRENRVAVLAAYGSALRFLLAVLCVPIAAALRTEGALPTVLWWIAVTSTAVLGLALFLIITAWRHIPERHVDPDEITDPTPEPAFAAEVQH